MANSHLLSSTVTRKSIYLLGLGSLIAFSGIGFLIIYFFSSSSFSNVLFDGAPLYQQILLGTIYGFVTAKIVLRIIDTKTLAPVVGQYYELIQSMRLSLFDVILFSACAGIGEEILFRGALQEHLGLILTSIIFVLIHGYLNPMNWRISIYGVFMTLVIIGIGTMYLDYGLISSIVAHMVLDIVLLQRLRKRSTTLPAIPDSSF